MSQPVQRIVRERRQYNKWAASETLEDYALRFTAQKARRWSPFRIANTALGAISFLACEAIGATLTLAYGFTNAMTAIVTVCALMFVIGLPITRYAARYGLDIDLLTRGAGFGYLGSTITSLIYASFTFLLFAIEASIMSGALTMLFGIPLAIAHLISALVVIPIAIYGIRLISRIQLMTQPVWLLLQFAPLLFLVFAGGDLWDQWRNFGGREGQPRTLDLTLFAICASTLLSLLPQVGEQADYLRFLPDIKRIGRWRWWTALVTTGPGWVVMGGFKLMAGSFLAVFALSHGLLPERAAEPTEMFFLAYEQMLGMPLLALILTGVFVVTCQIKINVTNAYAGSIAWSNFFARLTHAHPGRVVWLVFNVLLALLLMELGIIRVLEGALIVYANFAVAWVGALTADLVVNKPLGLSPSYIEFKRAHLYDINPVGVGAMLCSVVVSTLALIGVFGPMAQALSPFVGLLVAFCTAPLIAWATDGRYYIARPDTDLPSDAAEVRCVMCENNFERRDMAMCPAYNGPICSLCCTLEARCHDMCKTDSRFGQQIAALLGALLPQRMAGVVSTGLGQFLGIFLLFALVIGLLLTFVQFHFRVFAPDASAVITNALWVVFFALLIVVGVATWLLVLAQQSRRAAEQETARQTVMLMDEIDAHRKTDAQLQKAKEQAEAANEAKSRYIVGISHEIRSPLNAILGYAQLLERGTARPENAVQVIRRSAGHLSNLVDGLLDISRIESGLLRLNRDDVHLAELLDQIADMFRLQAEAKGVAFEFQRPADLPRFVHADQKRLRQLLINLLSNAVKYTEQGEVALRVKYPSSEVAEFEIADSGIGIQAQDLENIFKPFDRGGMPGALAVPGIGLGLTITKVLVEIMGGEIQVTSTPGQGSCFSVRLYLPSANVSEADARPGRAIIGYRGERRRLLLVDDDPVHMEMVESVLRPMGFLISIAREGLGGLKLAQDQKPDLALLDIAMPGMNGWELARALRTQEQAPGIIMVSANAHELREEQRSDAPHDAFLIKPIDIDALLARIGEVLNLQWVYAGDQMDFVAPALAKPVIPAAVKAHLDELVQLGRIGHVRAIEARLAELAGDAANQPFVDRLRELVGGFDLKAYGQLLEQARRDD